MEIMQDMGSAFFPCVCHKTQVVVLATNFSSHNPSTFCIFLCLLGGEGGASPPTCRAVVLKL